MPLNPCLRILVMETFNQKETIPFVLYDKMAMTFASGRTSPDQDMFMVPHFERVIKSQSGRHRD